MQNTQAKRHSEKEFLDSQIQWTAKKWESLNQLSCEYLARVILTYVLVEEGGASIPLEKRHCLVSGFLIDDVLLHAVEHIVMATVTSGDGKREYSVGCALRLKSSSRPSYQESFDLFDRANKWADLPEASQLLKVLQDDQLPREYCRIITEAREIDSLLRNHLQLANAGDEKKLCPPRYSSFAHYAERVVTTYMWHKGSWIKVSKRCDAQGWSIRAVSLGGEGLSLPSLKRSLQGSDGNNCGIGLLQRNGLKMLPGALPTEETFGEASISSPQALQLLASALEYGTEHAGPAVLDQIDEWLSEMPSRSNQKLQLVRHAFSPDERPYTFFSWTTPGPDPVTVCNMIYFRRDNKKDPVSMEKKYKRSQELNGSLYNALKTWEKQGDVVLRPIEMQTFAVLAPYQLTESVFYQHAMKHLAAEKVIREVQNTDGILVPKTEFPRPFPEIPEALATPKSLTAHFVHCPDGPGNELRHALHKMMGFGLFRVSQAVKVPPSTEKMDYGTEWEKKSEAGRLSTVVQRYIKKRAILTAARSGSNALPIFTTKPGAHTADDMGLKVVFATPYGSRPETDFSGLVMQDATIGELFTTGNSSFQVIDYPKAGSKEYAEGLSEAIGKLSKSAKSVVVFMRGSSRGRDPWLIKSICNRFPNIILGHIPLVRSNILTSGNDIAITAEQGLVHHAETHSKIILTLAMPPKLKKATDGQGQPIKRHSFNVWIIESDTSIGSPQRELLMKGFQLAHMLNIYKQGNQSLGEHVIMRLLANQDKNFKMWFKYMAAPRLPGFVSIKEILRSLNSQAQSGEGMEELQTVLKIFSNCARDQMPNPEKRKLSESLPVLMLKRFGSQIATQQKMEDSYPRFPIGVWS